MAGTKEGGKKAGATNKRLYGADYYSRIGAEGGRNGNTGGFAADFVGPDGLTGRERASIYGKLGGLKSRRTGVKNSKKGDSNDPSRTQETA